MAELKTCGSCKKKYDPDVRTDQCPLHPVKGGPGERHAQLAAPRPDAAAPGTGGLAPRSPTPPNGAKPMAEKPPLPEFTALDADVPMPTIERAGRGLNAFSKAVLELAKDETKIGMSFWVPKGYYFANKLNEFGRGWFTSRSVDQDMEISGQTVKVQGMRTWKIARAPGKGKDAQVPLQPPTQ